EFGDAVEGRVVEQYRAEQRLLRLDVVRRLPIARNALRLAQRRHVAAPVAHAALRRRAPRRLVTCALVDGPALQAAPRFDIASRRRRHHALAIISASIALM